MAENMMNSAHKSSNKEYRAGYDAVKWDKPGKFVSLKDYFATPKGQVVLGNTLQKGIQSVDFGCKIFNSADGRKP